jgi:hypothetical protein
MIKTRSYPNYPSEVQFDICNIVVTFRLAFGCSRFSISEKKILKKREGE